jgi:hypothetical protein
MGRAAFAGERVGRTAPPRQHQRVQTGHRGYATSWPARSEGAVGALSIAFPFSMR